MNMLNQDEVLRYSRHFSVKQIGISGQKKIKSSKVLLVGAGGIGSPASLYLTASGIGKLGVIDHDHVELSNLQRQVLYSESDCGHSKASCAKQKLSALNHHVDIQAYSKKLTPENAFEIIDGYDYVIDGSDNYQTRYLVSDVCAFKNTPLISASIYQFSGQLGLFNIQNGPCYRCVYQEPPPPGLIPNCAEAGVLGVVPGILATLAVNECLKLILGFKTESKLIQFDGLDCRTETFSIKPNPDCPICSQGLKFEDIPRHPSKQQSKSDPKTNQIDSRTLADWIKNDQKFLILDVRQDWERALCAIQPSVHIPLDQLEARHTELARDCPIVVQCKSGIRSQRACDFLQSMGFDSLWNLKGGILDWANTQQPELTRY